MIKLSVPGTLLYRDVVLRVVASTCRLVRSETKVLQDAGQELDAEFDSKVVSAVGEAFSNIAIHGYAEREPGSVEMEIQIAADGITIRMLDSGRAFDPTAVQAPDPGSLPESRMGLFIIGSLMDEVLYRGAEGSGSRNVL